ncbi:uncharacterized protein LOC117823261 [Xyrichtys novacula]|uniref:Uncharacterized protein LOC117823261 n=1 Tax=Xyrichtys novacula TaxID=13765 RepID=A0AAV1FP16_XYRNO|nr:uncharacterized protein LOC117823261 [Xyrichtys novacula]
MEKRKEGARRASHIWLLLLALLQIYTPSSVVSQSTTNSTLNTTDATTTPAPNPAVLTYRTRPANMKVAVGEPAVFCCGVPDASPSLKFTLYGGHGNYTLTCPDGHVEDIPEALYGNCEMKKGESLAVWTIKGTSYSDNGTRVECQQSNNPEKRSAVLHVYDSGINYAILIGCVIGGFFGTLLVVALAFVTLQRSDTVQRCFRGGGGETDDDQTTIVTKG